MDKRKTKRKKGMQWSQSRKVTGQEETRKGYKLKVSVEE